MFRRVLSSSRVLARTRSRQVVGLRGFNNLFNEFKMAPKDPILGVTDAFNADTSESKISVGVGAYRDDAGKPYVLPSVLAAEKKVVEAGLNMEYAPIDGLPEFRKQAQILAFGEGAEVLNRVASCQSLSGTGALRLAAALVARSSEGQLPTVLLPNPTWGNHFPIFEHAGLKTQTYRYYDAENIKLDIDGMLEDLNNIEGPAVILLHSCAHNPTGIDPSEAQWAQISEACKGTNKFVLFDNAYQGFASGDTAKDAYAPRKFVEDGHNIGLCQSFAKNLGLYGHRVGMFSVVAENVEKKAILESQIKICARAMYSSPPLHGARIVAEVLKTPELNALWQSEIALMSGRINDMRVALKSELVAAGSTKNWDHITDQIGMFSYTGLTVEQCKLITDQHHVYLTSNGRISMAGVTSANVKGLAQAIHAVTK